MWLLFFKNFVFIQFNLVRKENAMSQIISGEQVFITMVAVGVGRVLDKPGVLNFSATIVRAAEDYFCIHDHETDNGLATIRWEEKDDTIYYVRRHVIYYKVVSIVKVGSEEELVHTLFR